MSLLTKLFSRLQIALKLIKDPRVPPLMKIVPFLPLIYLVFPMDFIPDLIPGLGQLDDIGMIILGIEAFMKLVPQTILSEYEKGDGSKPQAANSNTVVDAEWREVKK
jgi:uncharacterized membrane protein YkvA (DUF1232 family)